MPQKNARSFSPSEFQSRILGWYHDNHRVLPWRENLGQGGNAVTPYAVWLSEIMLQQTTVPEMGKRWTELFFAQMTDMGSTALDLSDVVHQLPSGAVIMIIITLLFGVMTGDRFEL